MNMPTNLRQGGSPTRAQASRQSPLLAAVLLTTISTLAICTSFFLTVPSARAWAPLPAPPPPPAVYYGRILAGPGFTPTVGMAVTAWIGGTPCGQAQTQDVGGQVSYAIDVLAEGESAGCGAPGRVVTFRVNGQLMNPQTLWDDSRPHELDLWPAPPVADLFIAKTVTPGVVAPGQAVTYTLVYGNNGPDSVLGVTITDVVPITLTHVGYTSSGAAIVPTGSVSYTWQMASLAPGAGGVITITGVVSSGVGSGVFDLTNRATITATMIDANPNNTSEVTSVIDAEPPVPPPLLSPANGAIISDTTPTLTWGVSSSPDVAGYWLDWNGTVQDVGSVTQHTTSFLADGPYTWTVAAYDAVGNVGAYASLWTFTVDTAAPAVPVLLSPANGAVTSTNTLTLRWQASPSAAGYRLDFNGTVQDVGSVTQHTTLPLANGSYTWTVAAYDAVGNVSAYASPWVFTVDTVSPAVPVLLSPANGTVTNTNALTLRWQASPGAVGYRLDLAGTVQDVGSVTQHTTPPLADGPYTWTVAAYDAVGNVSAYASPWSCTVDTVSPIVISVAPPDRAVEVMVDDSVVIAFSRPMNAGTLICTVSPDSGGWSTLWDASGTVATLSHNSFDYQRTYTVTIIAAEDLLGNSLAGTPYTWQFTTASARFYLPLVLCDYQPPSIPWPTGK